MKYCQSCGRPSEDNMVFCANCGSRLPQFAQPSPQGEKPIKDQMSDNIVEVMPSEEATEPNVADPDLMVAPVSSPVNEKQQAPGVGVHIDSPTVMQAQSNERSNNAVFTGYQQPQAQNENFNQNLYAPYPPIPPKKESNVLGILSLVFGILSLALFWTMVIPLLLGIPAIVLGIISLVKSKSKGFGIVGIITGALGLICAVIFIVVLVYFSNANYSEYYDYYYNWENQLTLSQRMN